MKHLNKLFAFSALLALAACGETELIQPEEGGSTPAHQREIVLNLQNKLVMPAAGTRAEIATRDEKRIDALDVYVFGSATLNGVYSYQEKFSYRVDGSTVVGAGELEMAGTDGSTSTPTMVLKPTKGLFIKLYCVANQPNLYALDNVTDPAAPIYRQYTTFTPLSQSNPGDAANNTVTPGVPLEADFRKLTTRVIDPVNEADSIVPALPLVGANVATIDLQDFALASRLFVGVKLTRAVARFDIVNQAAESRFTIESVSLGNGRPTTSLFPLEAQRSAAGELITYPWRKLWGPGANKGARLSAFYSYGSLKADRGFLILKGTYRVNQTAPPEEVTHKIAFDQVKDGTGSYIEINPNHRYTVEITRADRYHVDFTFKIADWEEGDDMETVIPDNGMGALTTTPAGLYSDADEALLMSNATGYSCTLHLPTNAPLKLEGVTYDKPGFDWIAAEEVVMTPATRGVLWTQSGACQLTVKEGTFAEYPDATLLLSNTASGATLSIKVKAKI